MKRTIACSFAALALHALSPPASWASAAAPRSTDSVDVSVRPATVAPGDRIHLTIHVVDPRTKASLAVRPRAVFLRKPDSRESLKSHLTPLGSDGYVVCGTLTPGTYDIGYIWTDGKAPDVTCTTRLTVRPGIEVSVAPDPAQGRGLSIRMTNRAARSLTATATVDMIGNRTDTISNLVLASGESTTLSVSNAQPPERPLAAPLPVAVTVSSGAGQATWNGNVYFWNAGKTWAAPLELDSAQQWQSAGGAWEGAGDLSAVLRARYDERAFYIRAEVTDDEHTTAEVDGIVERGDSIRLVLDPNWSRRPGPAGADLVLARTSDGPRVMRLSGSPAPVPGSELKVSREGPKTLYEAMVPWSQLGIAGVRPGRSLGFSLLVNDDDGEGLDGWLMYGDGIRPEKRADRYGTLTLLPAAP